MNIPEQSLPPTYIKQSDATGLLYALIAMIFGLTIGIAVFFGTADPTILLPFKIIAASMIVSSIATILGRGSPRIATLCILCPIALFGGMFWGFLQETITNTRDVNVLPWIIAGSNLLFAFGAICLLIGTKIDQKKSMTHP